jgi:hypothetical protein
MIDVAGSPNDDMLRRHGGIVTYGASRQQG